MHPAWLLSLTTAALAVPIALHLQDAPRPAPKPATEPAVSSTTTPPPTPTEPRPNLVLITLDTTRADHVGCYGYERPTSPAIDALAAESLLFERCYSVLPHTTPSHCSILTGVYPLEHGILACSFRAAEEIQAERAFAPTAQLRTYPQILADHGWHNGGFVSAATVKRITGLAAGFEAWGEPRDEFRLGAEALEEALAWLATAPEPFFLWLHLFDAHAPPREKNQLYMKELAADDALTEHMKKLGIGRGKRGGGNGGQASQALLMSAHNFVQYDAGIRLMDEHVHDLRAALEKRGAWPHTTVVVTGDHGEGLGQHGFLYHGPVWNEQVAVPLLIRVPGLAPQRVTHVVSSIDILATAISLTPGLPTEEFLAQARGKNALAPDFEERIAFSMSPPSKGESSLTSQRWRLIHRENGDHALFDLDKDPYELENLYKTQPDVVAGMEKQLKLLLKDQRERRIYYAKGAINATLTAEEAARLRKDLEKLGYVEDGDDEAEEDDQGAEKKDGTRKSGPKKRANKKGDDKKDARDADDH